MSNEVDFARRWSYHREKNSQMDNREIKEPLAGVPTIRQSPLSEDK